MPPFYLHFVRPFFDLDFLRDSSRFWSVFAFFRCSPQIRDNLRGNTGLLREQGEVREEAGLSGFVRFRFFSPKEEVRVLLFPDTITLLSLLASLK